MSVAEHLGEGCALKATVRLAKGYPSVVTRLNRKAGVHAEAFPDERVQGVEVVALDADERHSYAHIPTTKARAKKFKPRIPAMALQLTDHRWSVREILLTQVFASGGER